MRIYHIMIIAFFIVSILIFDVYAEENNLLDKYPHVILSNGIIKTSIFIPDAQRGFYRSTRFEWSGMIWELKYKNHSYFLQRNEQYPLPLRQDHDPKIPNHAASLADQFFNGPPRLRNANTYMLIGIGNINASTKEIIDSGRWNVSSGKNWVKFVHKLKDTYGYGYSYVKRMELTQGKPELVITYSLKNTGTRTLTTEQYNHNFFLIDNDYVGKNYEVELFFPAKFNTFHPEKFNQQKNFLPYAVLKDNKIIFLKDLDLFLGSGDDHGFFTKMGGFSNSVAHNHCIIRNKRTGACVDIKGDFPLSAFNFWAEKCTICPEPFIAISIELGETKEWKRIYTFFVESK